MKNTVANIGDVNLAMAKLHRLTATEIFAAGPFYVS